MKEKFVSENSKITLKLSFRRKKTDQKVGFSYFNNFNLKNYFYSLILWFFNLLKTLNTTTIITGNIVATSNPDLRLPPAISEMLPTIAGLTIAPKSPANARNANIAVPPLGQL